MRDPGAVQIESLIVHIVDPRGSGLTLSEAPLPLAGDELLHEYIQSHIAGALGDSAATAARFKSIDQGAPSGQCAGIFAGTVDFVAGSREVARSLYAVLARDGRTRGADLVMCWYRAEALPGERFLALLKLDAAQVFRHHVGADAQGRTIVSFVPQPDAFTRERLQKAAFVQALEPRHPAYDMILLDRQVADRRRRDVARYFAEGFLQTEEAYDDRRRTEMLYRAAIVAANQLRPALSPAEQSAIEEQLHAALSARRFDLESWLAGLPVSESARAGFGGALAEALPDRSFDIDPAWGSRLVSKRTFRGDYGLRLQVQSEQFDELVTVELVSGRPGRRPFYRVTIETEKWDEVEK